ncbi:MAG: sulfatase-like hydrolase/transferase, partial [Cellvibrionales bacterium]|nr:sulfatase-like hydrolase/transferase [Cellvibrionales bacterium]
RPVNAGHLPANAPTPDQISDPARHAEIQSDRPRLHIVQLQGQPKRWSPAKMFAKDRRPVPIGTAPLRLTPGGAPLHLELRFLPGLPPGSLPAYRATPANFRLTLAPTTAQGAVLGTHYQIRSPEPDLARTLKRQGSARVQIAPDRPLRFSLIPAAALSTADPPRTFTFSLAAVDSHAQTVAIAAATAGQPQQWPIQIMGTANRLPTGHLALERSPKSAPKPPKSPPSPGQTFIWTPGTLADIDGLPRGFQKAETTATQWQRRTPTGRWRTIPGATNPRYTLTADDIGQLIRAQVRYIDSAGHRNHIRSIALKPAAAPRPNIILLMADDLGYGDPGYMGNPWAQTPNLDAMAKAGMRLDRFYSAAPVCSPTRGSVLTGRHPYRYGVWYANKGSLPREETTLPEILKQAGYRTGFFGKWHLGTLTTALRDGERGGRSWNTQHYSPPQAHGFDRVFAAELSVPLYDPMLRPDPDEWRGLPGNTLGHPGKWWPAFDGRDALPQAAGLPRTRYWNERGEFATHNLRGDSSRIILDRVVPFIEQAVAADQPFLAVVWFHTPHLPLVASDADRDAIATDNPVLASYHGAIRAMDRQIGRLRTLLREQGIAENSLLWFTSDNGPRNEVAGGLFRGILEGGKGSLREGGIRVPTLIEWPGRIPAGTRQDRLGVTSDILPTLADLLGVPLPAMLDLDGISLQAALFDQAPPAGERYIGFQSKLHQAWVGQRYKLLSRNGGADQLYDLIADPRETTNLVRRMPERAQSMRAQFERWRKAVAADWDAE